VEIHRCGDVNSHRFSYISTKQKGYFILQSLARLFSFRLRIGGVLQQDIDPNMDGSSTRIV